jgi:N-dimethylarginine dimethylaminohydrolase
MTVLSQFKTLRWNIPNMKAPEAVHLKIKLMDTGEIMYIQHVSFPNQLNGYGLNVVWTKSHEEFILIRTYTCTTSNVKLS